MSHDVFISYSTVNQAVAFAVCARLEEAGIRCWMAPRDAVPGLDYAEALHGAIREARIFVLIFSIDAVESKWVKKEVQLAAEEELAIIPFRLDDTTPSDGLSFFLGATHWLDAMTPPLERHIEKLAETAQTLLSLEKQRLHPYAPASDQRQASGASNAAVGPGIAQGARRLVARAASIVLVLAIMFVAVKVLPGQLFSSGLSAVEQAGSALSEPSRPAKDPHALATQLGEDLHASGVNIRLDEAAGRVHVFGRVFNEAELNEVEKLCEKRGEGIDLAVAIDPEGIAQLVRMELRNSGGINIKSRTLRGSSASGRDDRLLIQIGRGSSIESSRARAIAGGYFFNKKYVQVDAF